MYSWIIFTPSISTYYILRMEISQYSTSMALYFYKGLKLASMSPGSIKIKTYYGKNPINVCEFKISFLTEPDILKNDNFETKILLFPYSSIDQLILINLSKLIAYFIKHSFSI
jgi:hypothetical protein